MKKIMLVLAVITILNVPSFSVDETLNPANWLKAPSVCQASDPEATDYKCMSDCLDAGYMYGYCKKQCSY